MFTHQETSGSDGLLAVRAEPLVESSPPAPPALLADEVDTDPFESEEILIIDHRAHLGPAQQVEKKLGMLLGGGPVPVSHVRMLAQLGRRSHC